MCFFEISLAGFSLLLAVYCVRKKRWDWVSVFCLSLLTVLAGELINDHRKVTVYDIGFATIPGTAIPVFIVLSGAAVSTTTCMLAGKIAASLKLKSCWGAVFLLLFSLPVPFLCEWFGVRTGMWEWRREVAFRFNFIAGVWKFYFLFLFLPAIAGVLMFGRKTERGVAK